MKTKFFILVMACITTGVYSQNDSLSVHSSKEYFMAEAEYLQKISFKIGAGVFLPQGQLANYMGSSPLFELSLNFPLKKTKTIEAAVQFVVPEQQQDFLFLSALDTIQAQGRFMINGALKFKKRVHASAKSEWHLGLGIGLSTLFTNARNSNNSGDSDNDKSESINALLLNPGLEWVYHFSDQAEFTFGLGLHYAPYKTAGVLSEDIGAFGLTPKIAYRF